MDEKEIYARHNGEDMYFEDHGLHKKITYKEACKLLLDKGLILPDGPQIASLLDATYNENPKTFGSYYSVRWTLWKSKIRIFNIKIWNMMSETNPGLYVVYDNCGEGLSREFKINELEEKLKDADTFNGVRFSKDGYVRFAPKSTILIGELSKESLKDEGSTIATFGVEGADIMSKISKNFFCKPIISGGNDINSIRAEISAITGTQCDCWVDCLCDDRLQLYGDMGEGDLNFGTYPLFGISRKGKTR